MGLADELERLAALHREGELDDFQYEAAKSNLLDGASAQPGDAAVWLPEPKTRWLVGFTALVVVGFLLPWFTVVGVFNISGYEVPAAMRTMESLAGSLAEEGTSSSWVTLLSWLVWLIPAAAIVGIALAFLRHARAWVASLVSAGVSLGLLAFVLMASRLGIIDVFSIGVYVLAAASFALLGEVAGILPTRRHSGELGLRRTGVAMACVAIAASSIAGYVVGSPTPASDGYATDGPTAGSNSQDQDVSPLVAAVWDCDSEIGPVATAWKPDIEEAAIAAEDVLAQVGRTGLSRYDPAVADSIAISRTAAEQVVEASSACVTELEGVRSAVLTSDDAAQARESRRVLNTASRVHHEAEAVFETATTWLEGVERGEGGFANLWARAVVNLNDALEQWSSLSSEPEYAVR